MDHEISKNLTETNFANMNAIIAYTKDEFVEDQL
jgi:hypothetical protein